MPEPQTTPLDEELDNAILELHELKLNRPDLAPRLLHLIALVLRDTRERLAKSSRVALTDIEALFKLLDERNAGTSEAVRLAAASMIAPLAERVDRAVSRIEAHEAWPGRDTEVAHAIAKQDRAELDAALTEAEHDAAMKNCADATGYPGCITDGWEGIVAQIQHTFTNYSALKERFAAAELSLERRRTEYDRVMSRLTDATIALEELAMLAVGDEAAKLSREGCVNAVRAHIESQAEQLAVADADRVPLRMDLDEARGKLERLQPLLKAMNAWRTAACGDHYLSVAFDEWEIAETKAQNPELDDVAF